MPSFEPATWKRNLELPAVEGGRFLGKILFYSPVRQKRVGFVQKIFLIEVTVLPVTITLTTSPTLIPARS